MYFSDCKNLNEAEQAAGLTDEDIKMIEFEVPDFEYKTHKEAEDDFAEMKKNKEERKKQMQEVRKANRESNNEGANYVTITFSTFENKAFFMERFGFGHYDEFIKGERFEKMIERIDE